MYVEWGYCLWRLKFILLKFTSVKMCIFKKADNSYNFIESSRHLQEKKLFG